MINRYVPIIDQIAFPICNFLLFSILAKRFSESDISNYVYVYSIYLLLVNILIGVIFDPAPFFWKNTINRLKGKYILNLIFWFILITICLSMVFLFVINLAEPSISQGSELQMLCFFFVSALHIFFRRICFVSNRFVHSLISVILFLLCLIYVYLSKENFLRLGIFDFISVLNVIPSLYLIISIILTEKLYLSLSVSTLCVKVLSDHYNIGKWNISSSILSWYPANAHVLLLKHFHNFIDVAGIRVILNVLMPITQVISVVSVVFLKEVEINNSNKSIIFKTISLNIFLAIIYIFVIGIFGKHIIESLFGSNYIKLYPYLIMVSFSALPFAITSCLVNYYKYTGESKIIASNSAIMLPFSVIISLFLILKFGFAGAVAYTVIFDVLLAITLVTTYLKKRGTI